MRKATKEELLELQKERGEIERYLRAYTPKKEYIYRVSKGEDPTTVFNYIKRRLECQRNRKRNPLSLIRKSSEELLKEPKEVLGPIKRKILLIFKKVLKHFSKIHP